MEPNTSQPTNGAGGQSSPGNSAPQTGAPVAKGAENTTLMSVLAYIGILVVIPYLMAKDDPIVKFHIKQGLVLAVIEIAVWVAGSMVYMLAPLLMIVNLATLVLSIIGIVNVIQGNQKELPFVGQFSKHFNI
jgi:uncharacterized membrane protein